MLTAIHIQDFVLIRSLRLPLGPGMTALTGETGAGKSILLEALGLATGGRSGRGVSGKAGVRPGAKRGVVTVVYEPTKDHPVWRLLAENGLPDDDDQIILKRVQEVTGKGKAFINDQPVSVALLKEVGGALLELHGQHDGHGFLSSAAHRTLLDEFAGLAGLHAEVAQHWTEWRETEGALAERKARRDAAAREADYLRHVVRELENLSPRVGEEEKLAARRALLMASEKLRDDLVSARVALGDEAMESRLGAAGRRLSGHLKAFPGDDHPLAKAVDRIDRALSELMEARAALDDASEALGDDPDELDRAEERLFALRAAARKHGVSPEQLPGVLATANETLMDLDAGEMSFANLERTAHRAEEQYKKSAHKLSSKRRTAGLDLDKAVMAELAPLKLGQAVFNTQIKSDEKIASAHGVDSVEFMVATNPGASAGPLKTIASGGELSRFVLAMKAALSAKESRTVIIFDEIDAGVGGAVADAVGERLAALARDAQVLVVTHSPQVAARADTHWLVEKFQEADETVTNVRVLDAKARVEEIARMLSGARVSAEARAAAATLLGPRGAGNRKAQKPATKTRARRASA